MSGAILVTGFGPFDDHKVNASWESVKLLPKTVDEFTIITEEIPVSYDVVDKKIPELWAQYNPKLVVHVGVSSLAQRITIETCANRTGYDRKDYFGISKYLNTVCSSDYGMDCIFGGLSSQDICEQLNDNTNIKACTSSDAGRYLCEYTYYKSLNIDRNRVLFIHVPRLNEPYSSEDLSSGILAIIKYTLERVNNQNQ